VKLLSEFANIIDVQMQDGASAKRYQIESVNEQRLIFSGWGGCRATQPPSISSNHDDNFRRKPTTFILVYGTFHRCGLA